MTRMRPIPGVSDHALLRWLERALEMDLDAIRKTILTDTVRAGIEAGAKRIHVPEMRVTLIIAESGAIKTVLPIRAGRHR